MDNKAQWSLVAAAWVLAIGVIGLGLYAIRHFSSTAPLPNAEIQTFGTVARPLCPVDRVEVTASHDTPHVNFSGNTYYFCDNKDLLGRAHKKLFLMDPMLYLTGVSSHGTSVTAASVSDVTRTATPLIQPVGGGGGLLPTPAP